MTDDLISGNDHFSHHIAALQYLLIKWFCYTVNLYQKTAASADWILHLIHYAALLNCQSKKMITTYAEYIK